MIVLLGFAFLSRVITILSPCILPVLPVVLDNDYVQWNLSRNPYWPAHYFIDAKGRRRRYAFTFG
jgi:hypothetical protein